MSVIDIRKLSDGLLKGLIVGMGPLGIPASMLYNATSALMESQKKETEAQNTPSIEEIGQIVRKEVKQQAARDAWSKIQPACQVYFAILEDMRDGGLRPTDLIKLDDLMRLQLGSGSDLRQGLRNIYDPQFSPSDMSTAQYAFPSYALGASVEVSLMILEVPKNAKMNGSIGAHDWLNVRTRVQEHAEAVRRIGSYIRTYTIEKQLHDEMAAGHFSIGSPKIGERQRQLETEMLGGVGAALDIYHSLDRLAGVLWRHAQDDILAEMNELLKKSSA